MTASAAWANRQSAQPESHISVIDTEADTQDSRRPLLKVSLPRSSSDPALQSYGATERERFTSSPESFRRSSVLRRVPEEQAIDEEAIDDEEIADEVELELEEQGFYGGSYRRFLAMYTFVPVTSFLVFILLAMLPILIWPTRDSEPPPHPIYFPSPLQELLVSSALWSLTHLLRVPVYSLVSFIFRRRSTVLTAVIFNAIFAIIYNLLRLSSLPILRIRHFMDYWSPTCHDYAFRRIWWLALGWAGIETVVGITQEYAQIGLYKDVMIPEEQVVEVVENGESASGSRRGYGSSQEELLAMSPRPDITRVDSNNSSQNLADALEQEVDRDIEQLVNLKEREELEEIYGLPIIKIPVFVSCLQRIDSIIITVGIFLILSASYLRSTISLSTSTRPSPPGSNKPIIITFPLIGLLNFFLCLIYTPLVLPRLGVHTTAYIGFLVGLGTLFAGLGLWGALS
ncbi:hypothetical protein C8Q75DRAFT_716240 [Abortiporus biennis]|nr:hypothetical protein C8Q75DRAFT_716240 [Abortiporus biennis]